MDFTIGVSSILSSYIAGLLTSLTPCVYPMIPLTLGYLGSRAENLNRKTVLAFIFGQVFMFGIMGFIAVELGEVFGFISQNKYLQISMGMFLLIFAYYSWQRKLPEFLILMSDKISKKTAGSKLDPKASLINTFIIGLTSTLIASPCSTPVLGSVLALVSQSESRLQGVVLMTIYGLGISTIFSILGMGLVQSKKLPKSGKWMQHIHNLSVLLLIAGGIYFIIQGVSFWI